MLIALLIVSFAISFIVCFIVARVFRDSVTRIMDRLVKDDIAAAWSRYIIFAIYVVGISGGVRLWEIEKYISPRRPDEMTLTLTTERWIFEIYRTIIETLKSDAWMLLVFFVFALIAYVIVAGLELRHAKKE